MTTVPGAAPQNFDGHLTSITPSEVSSPNFLDLHRSSTSHRHDFEAGVRFDVAPEFVLREEGENVEGNLEVVRLSPLDVLALLNADLAPVLCRNAALLEVLSVLEPD